MKSGCGRPTTTPTSRRPPRSTRTSRTGAPTTSSVSRGGGGELPVPRGRGAGAALADWIMHWYDPDESRLQRHGKRPGTRYETVMPWEHPSRTGAPFPPPDWSPCGTSLEPVDGGNRPEISLAACEQGCMRRALRGRRRVRDRRGLDNCGGSRHHHLWGEGRAARPRAPTSSRARSFIKSHLRRRPHIDLTRA